LSSQLVAIRRAILSVSDKTGVAELARGLVAHKVEILSTGGTARALSEAGIKTVAVSDYTGAPEILDGRVKTLHPKIHGGLLGRDLPDHRVEMEAQNIGLIDLVVVNLYPFEETVARAGISLEEAIENIDIGGPSMLRSAAKNHERVAVVVDPADYQAVLAEMQHQNGALSRATRFRLARKAFAHTAAYDGAIAAYLSSFSGEGAGLGGAKRETFPTTLTVQFERAQNLRYGENPHQQAAFYRDARWAIPHPAPGVDLAAAEVLQGKELSYNNILDIDAALGCCLEFELPTAVVVKHTNPCGVASDTTGVAAAYRQARDADPTSAFGGIVAVNREVDEALAALLGETFLECVVAPGYSQAARRALAAKKNLRLLAAGTFRPRRSPSWSLRSVAGGVLLQSADTELIDARQAKVVTKRAPSAAEFSALDFAWRVGKHVKSNAIVFCVGTRTTAVGAGQMSRVDSARIAVAKAQMPLQGSVAASDAFFPFRDGLDQLAAAGATAVIQPGGSVRDDEVIAAADEHGMAMLFTGMRHFRH
jgi:phosphoribosylaminoimidazolecarboxamide formyltransferase/IMP cyclohydrolase